jgi:hypothetical protein
MDTAEGNSQDPTSLHKYLYAGMDPVDRVDPSGHDFDLGSMAIASGVAGTIAGMSVFSYQMYKGATVGQAAKAGGIAFLAGAGITASVYAVAWAGTLYMIGVATGWMTFSQQIYNAFQDGEAYAVTLTEDLYVVRYFGGGAGATGSWWSTDFFSSSEEAVSSLALNPSWGNTAQQFVTGIIPKGTQILTGYAAAQGGLIGGAHQIYLQSSSVVQVVSTGTLP